MAIDMNTKRNEPIEYLSEEEIDNIVISQADDDSEWEEPIRVSAARPANLSIPGELTARASFFAHIHREPDVEEWIMRIIRERIELEEMAFVEVKRELIAKEEAWQH